MLLLKRDLNNETFTPAKTYPVYSNIGYSY